MLMTENLQNLLEFQKLKMRNDTFCFMPYFQLYETILFLLLIHLGFKNVCNLVLYPIVKRRHADFKNFGIYRCPQPNYDSFWGKVFSRYI